MIREPPICLDEMMHRRRQLERTCTHSPSAETKYGAGARCILRLADMAYSAAEDGCGDTEFFSSGSASLESRATAAAISRSHLGESRFIAAASE